MKNNLVENNLLSCVEEVYKGNVVFTEKQVVREKEV